MITCGLEMAEGQLECFALFSHFYHPLPEKHE